MNFCQWEMPEDKTQVLWVLTLQRVHAVARHACVRTFVIAVLEQRYFSFDWTLDVVVSCDWRGQLRGYPGHVDMIARSTG